MQFNSYSYLFFLLVVVTIFWNLPKKLRRGYVLVISLVFYATWNVWFVLIPVSLCAAVYIIARFIVFQPQKSRRWMWCGVTLVLSVLAFFKYRAFLIANVNVLLTVLGLTTVPWAVAIALPLGISFYSFEAISYLIDVRQRRIAKLNFLDLNLFIMFWPHLMAGPIVRVRELIPQLKFDSKFDTRFILRGVDRLIWGLVQKNVVANNLGVWVDAGFKSQPPGGYTTLDSWFLAIAFGLQIYFDFAAYSNMAIGAAQLLGIKLPENFRCPYHAATPVEFWSRWHMTLSRWVRDYLFFPLNAKFGGAPFPFYTSLIGVMALVGLWHGAGWGFVTWGVLQGVYLVLYRIYESFRQNRQPELAASRISAASWRMFTLLAVTLAWVPFRAGNIGQTWGLLSCMLFRFSAGAAYPKAFYWMTASVALFCAAEPYLVRLLSVLDGAVDEDRRVLMAGRLVARGLVYACGLLLFMVFDQQATEFIYFQF
jgi:alginate O-acetyltransferase complex protein AlgI